MRRLLGPLAAIMLSMSGASAGQHQQDAIPVSWVLPQAELSKVQQSLDIDGEIRRVQGEDVRGAPLFLLVGLAVLPSLVDTLVTYYRDTNEGGVVVEAVDGELVIRNDRALPYGVMVLRDKEGVEVQNFRSTPEQADLSAAIAELAKSM